MSLCKLRDFAIVLFVEKNCAFLSVPIKCEYSSAYIICARRVARTRAPDLILFLSSKVDQSYQYLKFRNRADPYCKHAAAKIPHLNN